MSFSARISCFAALIGLLVLPAPLAAQIAPDSSVPSAGMAAQTLRDIVSRYLYWRGPAFGDLQTLHERMYVETQAGRQSGALWMDRHGRMRREFTAAGARTVQAATPDGAWRVETDGKVVDDPDGFEHARRYAALEFGDALTGRAGATATLIGPREFEDRSWQVVRVTFGDADTYDVLLDPAAGGLCCYMITEKGAARTVMFGDWRLVDGVRMPFAQLQRAATDTEFRISAVELNRDLDVGLFAKPAAGAAG
jgi:hypothetical protein